MGALARRGADDYYLEERDRFLNEDKTLLDTRESSLPAKSASILVQRKRAWLAGFSRMVI
jgi:hypothetical protein